MSSDKHSPNHDFQVETSQPKSSNIFLILVFIGVFSFCSSIFIYFVFQGYAEKISWKQALEYKDDSLLKKIRAEEALLQSYGKKTVDGKTTYRIPIEQAMLLLSSESSLNIITSDQKNTNP